MALATPFTFPPQGGPFHGHPTRPAPPPPLPGVMLERDKHYGSPIPLVVGRGVVSGQIVYQGKPTSGPGQVFNGTLWSLLNNRLGTDVVIALCEAPVTSVVQCYRRLGTSFLGIVADWVNKLALSGGSVDFITAATATAWSQYVGTTSEGLAHSGTAHVRIHAAHLADDGSFPETKWEVQGTIGVTGVSTPDAEPADFLVWLLTDTMHGLGFDISMVNVETGVDGSAASSFRRYTRARGWYLSRVIDQGDSIAAILEELLAATNSTLVWVDGVLTAVPLDDEASSTGTFWPGHGTYPYTPVTTTVAIGDADYASGDGDPVRVERRPRSSVASIYPIDYTLRVNDSGAISYATHHAEYQSDVFSTANGLRRADPLDLTKWILGERHAWFVSYLAVQRSLYHRAKYTFTVKPRFGLLAPGDFVSVSDSALGLSGVNCRVETPEEKADGTIEVTALEWPLGTTKAFGLGTTAPVGRWSDGQATPLARNDLQTTPPGVVDVAKLTSSQVDKDNLWPNPSSEIAPPTGADTTQPEWADRVNAGAGAYSGSWVREVTAALDGFWVPCSPGAIFYAEAQAKRTAGTGSGGRLNVGFYPTLGSFTSGTVTSGAYSTSASWALVSVTSAQAPAGSNAAYISYEAATGDTVQFDSLLARRVIGYPVVASDVVSLTMGTGWTVSSGDVRKVGGLICGYVSLQVDATGAWTSILTFPVGSRPPNGFNILGLVQDATGPVLYVGRFSLAGGSGVLSLTHYDNGTSLVTPPFAIGSGDQVGVSFAFPWV